GGASPLRGDAGHYDGFTKTGRGATRNGCSPGIWPLSVPADLTPRCPNKQLLKKFERSIRARPVNMSDSFGTEPGPRRVRPFGANSFLAPAARCVLPAVGGKRINAQFLYADRRF